MKKSVIAPVSASAGIRSEKEWLDVEQLASVEVTSEDPRHPVESVFGAGDGPGWRAAENGQQVIRLLFAQPQSIRQIHLKFSESEVTRVQEFTLRWASSPGGSFKEIVRQQWNFSPDGSKEEIEDYHVELASVAALELTVTPDVSRGPAVASLAQWRIA